MQSKVIVANELESSSTMRLTPKVIGELLVSMSVDQIGECMQQYVDESYYVKQEIIDLKLKAIMNELKEV